MAAFGPTGTSELWLDHDRGTDASTGRALTVMLVVGALGHAATDRRAYRIATIYIHTANLSGAVAMSRAFTTAGYPIRRWRGNRIWIKTCTEITEER